MLNNLIKSLSLTLLSLALVSCGGGSGSSSSSNTPQPATVKSIVPYGVVASGIQKSLSIAGTNFVSGMTVSVTNKNGSSYPVSSVSVSSDTVITANVKIDAAPTERYVNITVQSSSGAVIGTVTLGVASAEKTLSTDVQPIFDAKCISCHDGSSPHYLDLRNTVAAKNLIVTNSSLCSNKFRVIAGNPTRSISVLIDKIQVAFTGVSACSGDTMPPFGSSPLTPTEVQTIVDWVAGGAN
jgi:cytochrome c5